MKRGFKEPQGGVWLNEGDLWKYGTTKNSATRYSHSFLDERPAALTSRFQIQVLRIPIHILPDAGALTLRHKQTRKGGGWGGDVGLASPCALQHPTRAGWSGMAGFRIA